MRGTLRGRVAGANGEPAVGALVDIAQHGNARRARVGADGRFEIPSLAKAGFSVKVTRSHERLANAKNGQLTMKEFPAAELTLQLELASVLAGHVIDDEGKPVRGARIRARVKPTTAQEDVESLKGVAQGIRRRKLQRLERVTEERVGDATTDAQGSFVIHCERPGSFDLVVTAPRWGDSGMRTTVRGPYATGTTNVLYEVDPGERITGRVADEDGQPVASARVIGAWVEPKGWGMGMSHNNYQPHAQTDASGAFVLKGLDVGVVGIVVSATGYKVLHVERVRVGTDDVEFVVERGLSIEGLVVDEEGRPHGGLPLKIERIDEKGDFSAFFERQRSGPEGMSGSAWLGAPANSADSTTTDSNGRFAFFGLLPGEFHMRFDTPMLGPDEPIVPPTKVRAGVTSVRIQTRRALTVSGRLVDNEGKPAVFHWMRGDRFNLQVSARQDAANRRAGAVDSYGRDPWDLVDARGRFRIGGLLPGAVTIHVGGGDAWHSRSVETTAGKQDIDIVLERMTDEDRKAEEERLREPPKPPKGDK